MMLPQFYPASVARKVTAAASNLRFSPRTHNALEEV
jgi:hypothetical protein